MVDRNVLEDGFPDGIFTVGESLQIDFCSDSAASLVGYAPAELVGSPFARLMCDRVPVRVRDDGTSEPLPELVAALAEADARSVGASDSIRGVGPIRHKSGVAIEVGWLVLGIVSRAGGPRIVVSLHRLEESIRFADPKSEDSNADRVHQIIFDNAPVGIIHFDERGVITACNDLFVTIIGSTRNHLVGLDTRTLPSPDIVHCIDEALDGRRASYVGDYKSATADKTTPVAIDFAPIFTQDGRSAGGVGLIRDITEHRNAERMLARAERMASLGTLAAGMVHEIQNPLAFTVTSLEVASRILDAVSAGRPLDGEQLTLARTALQSAREGALRVSNIARDLKTFARADDEKRSEIDVEAALETALKLVRPQLRGRARLERRYEPIARVFANEHRLVQLFVNLLVNSVEAIEDARKDDNKISVATRLTNDGRVEITIEDTGKGIAQADLAHVFEPFWTNKPSGMGLGLAICHGIVASLGGEIFHETPTDTNGASRRGTRMSIVLPAASERAPEVMQPKTSRPAPPPPADSENARSEPKAGIESDPELSRRGRILVIDDEERLATTIRMALSPSHDVEIATSGRAGLERLSSGDYDVVLCDLFLPDLAGPDIFEKVAAERPEVAKRFVFLTGGAFTDRARSFLQRVSNARLEKPFDLGALEALIAERVASNARSRPTRDRP